MKNQNITLFSERQSPRLRYVLNFIFKEVFGLNFTLIVSKKINSSGSLKSNNLDYSLLKIQPNSLLFEDGIHPNPEYRITDLFSEVFFHLSRYEEYLPFEHDIHQRFPATESYLFKNNQLLEPRIDLLLNDLKGELLNTYPNLEFQPKTYKFLPTIDIDRMFQFSNQSFIKSMGGIAKDLMSFKFNNAKDRLGASLGLKEDAYDLSKKEAIHKVENLRCFVLNASDRQFDNSLAYEHPEFKNQIEFYHKLSYLGIHPSYDSNTDFRKLKKEKSEIEELINEPIIRSRQHFIKLHLPSTYLNLLKIGVKEDYSMGYADSIGFRAGTARDFYWYDLQNEIQTELRIFPFCFMDVSLKDYMKLSTNEAKEVIIELHNQVESLGGNFSFIVHNNSLSSHGEWKSWSPLFWDVLLQKFK